MNAPRPPFADQAALSRIGVEVQARLAANPAVIRLPTNKAEMFAVENFLGEQDCAALIAMIDAVAQPSLAYETDNAHAIRSSYSADVDPYDPFVAVLQQRIDDLLGLPGECGETVQGQRYREGQEFRPHFDWFDTASDYWPVEQSRGGQRGYTAMIYLNNLDAGGETAFPVLGMRIAPRRGVLLMWNNANRDGSPNEATLHAGMAVQRGVKYVVTKWYRTRRWG